jgi:tellurite resistance protein TehA-like permease
MERVRKSLMYGFLLTAVAYALHIIVLRHFSWKDKPMMPNFFTYLLLPGYMAATDNNILDTST